jgi:hypothetical protein
MKDNNARKSEQLGMPFGTANGKLRKIILFDLVKRFDLNGCYRCGGPIEIIEEFSIEHKKAWLDVDPDLFWDLDNIAFSHLNCNVSARRVVNRATVCFRCGVKSPRRNSRGWAKECKDCATLYKREWRARTGKS